MDIKSEYKMDVEAARRIWSSGCGADATPKLPLTPAHLIDCYNSSRDRPLRQIELRDWVAFENCIIDWSYDDFSRLLCLDEIPGETRLILVTDEGLREKCAFGFPRIDFQAFAQWYESTYHMGFFQSADYILFDDSLSHVRILHHEGVLFRN